MSGFKPHHRSGRTVATLDRRPWCLAGVLPCQITHLNRALKMQRRHRKAA